MTLARYWVVLTSLLAILVGQAAASDGLTIEGRVMGHDGRPIAGAGIWLSSQAEYAVDSAWVLVAESKSTASGEFQLTIPNDWIQAGGGLRELSVLAWGEGHGVFQATWTPDDVPVGVRFEPWLPEPVSTVYTVIDETGAPYVGARVFPTSLAHPDKGSTGQRHAAEAWYKAGLPLTGKDGKVTLPFAVEDPREITIAPATGGTFHLTWISPSGGTWPTTLVLERPFERTVMAAEDPPAGLKIMAEGQFELPGIGTRRAMSSFRDEVTLDPAPPWTLRVPGKMANLYVASDDAAALAYVITPVPAEGSTGERPAGLPEGMDKLPSGYGVNYDKLWRLSQSEGPGRVTGSATFGEDRAPLGGVRLCVIMPVKAWLTSDEDGRFSAPNAGEFVTARATIPPAGYVGEVHEHVYARSDAETGRTELPPVALEQGAWLQGVAKSADGQPMDGVWITAAPSGQHRSFRVLTAVSGADGSFRLGPASTGAPYDLIGHAPGQIGSCAAKAGDDVTLSLEPSVRCRVSVTASQVDPHPEPPLALRLTLVGEDAQTYANVDGGLIAGGRISHRVNLGDSILLERPLEPGGIYALRFEGWSDEDRQRMEPGQTKFFSAETLAQGVVIEPSLRRTASGVLANPGLRTGERNATRVRLRSSDDWAPVDALGKFTVVAGEAAVDVLLVEQGGVIEGVSLETELASGVVRGPVRAAPAMPEPEESHRAIATSLAWPKVKAAALAGADEVGRWLKPLMHSDPDGVLAFLDSGAWADTEGTRIALMQLGERLAPARPKDALAIAGRKEVESHRPYIAYLAVQGMERGAALQELAAVASSASEDEDSEASILKAALVAKCLFEMGEDEAARSVIDPALKSLKALPRLETNDYVWRELGEVAILFDEGLGNELIGDPRREHESKRSLAQAAAHLAKFDADAAERAFTRLGKAGGEFNTRSTLPAAAYHLAGKDAARATELVDAFAPSVVPYGLVALRLAERGESDAAREALANAFGQLEAEAADGRSRTCHPIAAAAFLVAVASATNQPDLEHWHGRALAIPRSTDGRSQGALGQLATAEACLAISIARTGGAESRAIAAALVAPWTEAASEETPRGMAARQQAAALGAALALAYPSEVESRVEALPEDVRARALLGAVTALAYSKGGAGSLLAAQELVYDFWWPGQRLR